MHPIIPTPKTPKTPKSPKNPKTPKTNVLSQVSSPVHPKTVCKQSKDTDVLPKRALVVDKQTGCAEQLEQYIDELQRANLSTACEIVPSISCAWKVTRVVTAEEASMAVTQAGQQPFDCMLVSAECYFEQGKQWLQWLSSAAFCTQLHEHAPGD